MTPPQSRMETQKSDEQCAASDKNKKEKAEAEAEAGSRGERNKAIKSQSDVNNIKKPFCLWLSLVAMPCPVQTQEPDTHPEREREGDGRER